DYAYLVRLCGPRETGERQRWACGLPVGERLPIQGQFTNIAGGTIDDKLQVLDPRVVWALRSRHFYIQMIGGCFAGEVHPDEVAALIGKGIPVVHVEVAMAIRPGINPQFERTLRSFPHVLHDGLLRNDGARFNVNRQSVERWV